MRLVAVAGATALACGLAGCLGNGGPVPPSKDPAGAFPHADVIDLAEHKARSQAATVWAVGDADGSAAAKRVARLVARDRPARLLYLGDVYESGTAEDFRSNFHSVFGAFKHRMLPTPGNHDWPNHAEGYDPYWAAVTGRRPPSFYALRLAGWRIVSLNSEEPLDPSSPQLRWVREEMRGRDTCWLAFWHRPRYSAGLHGDQADVAPLWNAVRGHAALVLGGHDHDMQHVRSRAGTTILVSGAGGHGRYPVDRQDPRLIWGNDRDYGALRLRLRPGGASFAFVASDGRRLHSGSVACRR